MLVGVANAQATLETSTAAVSAVLLSLGIPLAALYVFSTGWDWWSNRGTAAAVEIPWQRMIVGVVLTCGPGAFAAMMGA